MDSGRGLNPSPERLRQVVDRARNLIVALRKWGCNPSDTSSCGSLLGFPREMGDFLILERFYALVWALHPDGENPEIDRLGPISLEGWPTEVGLGVKWVNNICLDLIDRWGVLRVVRPEEFSSAEDGGIPDDWIDKTKRILVHHEAITALKQAVDEVEPELQAVERSHRPSGDEAEVSPRIISGAEREPDKGPSLSPSRSDASCGPDLADEDRDDSGPPTQRLPTILYEHEAVRSGLAFVEAAGELPILGSAAHPANLPGYPLGDLRVRVFHRAYWLSICYRDSFLDLFDWDDLSSVSLLSDPERRATDWLRGLFQQLVGRWGYDSLFDFHERSTSYFVGDARGLSQYLDAIRSWPLGITEDERLALRELTDRLRDLIDKLENLGLSRGGEDGVEPMFSAAMLLWIGSQNPPSQEPYRLALTFLELDQLLVASYVADGGENCPRSPRPIPSPPPWPAPPPVLGLPRREVDQEAGPPVEQRIDPVKATEDIQLLADSDDLLESPPEPGSRPEPSATSLPMTLGSETTQPVRPGHRPGDPSPSLTDGDTSAPTGICRSSSNRCERLKEPASEAFTAYALHFLSGLDQRAVAKRLSEELGRPICQGSVSRWCDKVKKWLGAGRPWPGATPKIIPTDPSRIELGPRAHNYARRKSLD